MIKKLAAVYSDLPYEKHPLVDPYSLLEEIASPMKYRIKKSPVPRLYSIETTTKCNLTCPFCPRTKYVQHLPRANKDMSTAQIGIILDKMPWTKSVGLHIFGEPFCNEDFSLLVAECERRGIETCCASNLNTPDYRKIEDAVEMGLRYLKVDIDSIDEKEYRKYRPGGDLDFVIDNLRLLCSKRFRKVKVAVQAVAFKGIEKIYTPLDFNKKYGFMPDSFEYKFFDGFRSNFIEREIPAMSCAESFYGFSVMVDGTVIPCDRDWAGEYGMGNIFEQSIDEIWNGEKFNSFREQIACVNISDQPSICRRCYERSLINCRSQRNISCNHFTGKGVCREKDMVFSA